MPASDLHFLRRAISLARKARESGEEPFGAVLVYNGEVVAETHSRKIALSDPTAHAELLLIREYCPRSGLLSLEGHTLYASAEPCPMCAGAIHWARISRVVFSVSQAMLQSISGGRLKPSAESIINCGSEKIEVVGPLIPEEGLAVFEGYTFVRKSGRRSAE
jgi:tRNA(Arg) A34 adenosine deaminase TadA